MGTMLRAMTDFCMFFPGYLDRNIIDETGIAGRFDIHLDLSPEDLFGRHHDDGDTTDRSAAVFAAVRTAMQKLGLKLDPAKRPIEFLVIDHVEKPSAN